MECRCQLLQDFHHPWPSDIRGHVRAKTYMGTLKQQAVKTLLRPSFIHAGIEIRRRGNVHDVCRWQSVPVGVPRAPAGNACCGCEWWELHPKQRQINKNIKSHKKQNHLRVHPLKTVDLCEDKSYRNRATDRKHFASSAYASPGITVTVRDIHALGLRLESEVSL